jgi:hypothetical protein
VILSLSPITKKGLTQSIGPEFKSQYQKKKKKNAEAQGTLAM